jgi:hypothetical protein
MNTLKYKALLIKIVFVLQPPQKLFKQNRYGK